MFNSTALQTICSSVILSVFLPQQDVPLSTVLYSPHVEKHEAFIKYPCVSLDMSIELRIRSYGSEGHVGAAQMMKELGFEKNASVVRKKKASSRISMTLRYLSRLRKGWKSKVSIQCLAKSF